MPFSSTQHSAAHGDRTQDFMCKISRENLSILCILLGPVELKENLYLQNLGLIDQKPPVNQNIH